MPHTFIAVPGSCKVSAIIMHPKPEQTPASNATDNFIMYVLAIAKPTAPTNEQINCITPPETGRLLPIINPATPQLSAIRKVNIRNPIHMKTTPAPMRTMPSKSSRFARSSNIE